MRTAWRRTSESRRKCSFSARSGNPSGETKRLQLRVAQRQRLARAAAAGRRCARDRRPADRGGPAAPASRRARASPGASDSSSAAAATASSDSCAPAVAGAEARASRRASPAASSRPPSARRHRRDALEDLAAGGVAAEQVDVEPAGEERVAQVDQAQHDRDVALPGGAVRRRIDEVARGLQPIGERRFAADPGAERRRLAGEDAVRDEHVGARAEELRRRAQRRRDASVR